MTQIRVMICSICRREAPECQEKIGKRSVCFKCVPYGGNFLGTSVIADAATKEISRLRAGLEAIAQLDDGMSQTIAKNILDGNPPTPAACQ